MQVLHTPQQAAQWLHDTMGAQGVLRTDSRQIKSGDAFVAWPGGVVDGRQFIEQALERGAAACLMEQVGCEQFAWANEQGAIQQRVATYPELKPASGWIASEFYQQPSREVDVVAITGTNGKTSTAWWLAHALENLQTPSAIAGTLGVGRVGQLELTGLTTPDPIDWQTRLRALAQQGVRVCALEASSIGLAEHRLAGTHVRLAMLTNFTQDHLDYHGDMEAYWQAKQSLFGWSDLGAAIINVDDPKGRELAQRLKAKTLRVWTVGLTRDLAARHLYADEVHYSEQGLSFHVCEGEQTILLNTTFVGEYNILNLLGVVAALRELGYDLAKSVKACERLPAVPGRMQMVCDEPLVVVDYAHTPDALSKALQALVGLAKQRQGDLVCVVGCGGNRDSSKRPLMTQAAQTWAQQVVLTSDNPRDEAPESIIDQMLMTTNSSQSLSTQVDRAQAIQQAISGAKPQDVILIAGKGHEDYQEIKGVKYPFSDVEHAQRACAARRAHV